MAIQIEDYTTGAPKKVQIGIATLSNPADQLAALRKIYPDAELDTVTGNNFIFTNPDTGKLTHVFPKGISAVDVLKHATGTGEMVGGTAGGIAGGIAGGVPGAIAGAGAGGLLGHELVGRGVRWLTGVEDPRSPAAQSSDAATTGLVNAAGEGVGRAAFALPGLRNFAFDRVGRIMEGEGIPGTMGNLTGSRFLQSTEAGIAGTPFGGSVLATNRRSVDAAGNALDTAATRMLPAGMGPGSAMPIGAAGRADIVGSAIVRAAQTHGQRAARTVEGIANDVASTGTRVDPQAVRALRADLQQELSQAETSQNPAMALGIRRAQGILDDAEANGGLDFRTALRLRTQIGQELDHVAPGGIAPVEQPALRRVYGALRDDLYRTAGEADQVAAGAPAPTNARQRLVQHDTDIASLRDPAQGGEQTVLERLGNMQGTDALVSQMDTRRLLSQPEQTRALLAGLDRNGEGQAATQLRASLLEELGLGRSGARGATDSGFSFQTLLTNYNDARKSGTLDIIFPRTGGTAQTRRSLDNLVEVAQRMRETPTNFPNTGNALAVQGMIGGAAGGVGALAGGDDKAEGAIGAVLLSALGQFGTARLLSSPGMARNLTSMLSAASTGRLPNIPGILGRIAGMSIEDPLAQADRDAFLKVLGEDPRTRDLLPAKPGKRAEVDQPTVEPPPPPGLMGPPPGQQAMAGPPMAPPGLLAPGPSPDALAASQYASNAQPGPLQGMPPGLLAQDPEAILRLMMQGGGGGAAA